MKQTSLEWYSDVYGRMGILRKKVGFRIFRSSSSPAPSPLKSMCKVVARLQTKVERD